MRTVLLTFINFLFIGNIINAQNNIDFIQNEFNDNVSQLKKLSDNEYLIDSAIVNLWSTEQSNWLLNQRIEYAYNLDFKNTQKINQEWNSLSNKWINSQKQNSTFDNNGNMTELIFANWEEASTKWVNDYMCTYTFDENNFYIEMLYKTWNLSIEEWENVNKIVYLRDENGTDTSLLRLIWDESISDWKNYSKRIYTINENNDIIQSKGYDWDNESSVWNLTIKDTTIYDSNFNEIVYISELWDEGCSCLINCQKDSSVYDDNNNIKEFNRFIWDQFYLEWEIEAKYISEYNANGYKIEYTAQRKFNGSDLENYFKYFYEYDVNGNNDITLKQYWNSSNSNWNDNEKTYKYYSDHTATGIEKASSNEVFFFPNPAKDILIINNIDEKGSVTIYNINGSLLYKKKLTSTKTILNIDQFEKGVYLIKIDDGYNQKVERLVKE